MSTQTERFYEVDDSTIEKFNEAYRKIATPTKINFKIYGDSKLKRLIEIKKYSPDEEFNFKYQIKVKINEDLLHKLDDDDAVELLLREALNGLEVNGQTGVIKIKKPDTATFASIIEKFSLGEVSRAKELERLTLQQTEDREVGVTEDVF